MLKASLPFFLKKERKAPQNPSNDYIGELNLLGRTTEIAPDYSQRKFVSFLQAVIAFICIVFLLMAMFSLFLDMRLKSLKEKVDQSYADVAVYEREAQLAREIDLKTVFYKNLLNSRLSVGDKAEILFSNLGGTMSALSSRVDAANFKILVEGNTPLDFARLLNAYLDSGKIEKIIIKSAELQRGKGTYKVEFEGTFK